MWASPPSARKIGGEYMGYRKDITKSQIFMESSDDFNSFWYSFKRDKFYHNIDTYYYTVSVRDDYNKNPNADNLLYELKELKRLYLENRQMQPFNDKLFCTSGRFDDIYDLRLTCPDMYDIFISSYLPNKSTPRFVVQLRSSALWIYGVKQTIEDSYYQLLKVFQGYNLEVGNVYENRIDYCYHTNYIQDMYKFFEDKKMSSELKTNMSNWRKDGHVYPNGFDLNYFALGTRNSNNVFLRIYDKTREVVEMNYKGFFIEIWFQHGLISKYDKYCLEYAYKHGNYDKRYEGMLKFYLEFGKDELHKKEIEHYLKDYDNNFYKIRHLALSLMPQITTICNIEFQTKRRFYSVGDNQIDGFDTLIKSSEKLSRLIKIVDNRRIFLNYLTHYNLRFVDQNGNYKSWWSRLRGTKIDSLGTNNLYARTYQKNLDAKKMFRRTMRTLGTNSLYNGGVKTDLAEDILDLISKINDNDMLNFYNEEYINDKEKKYQIIKNQLDLEETSDLLNND
jgi:hypothetical protein